MTNERDHYEDLKVVLKQHIRAKFRPKCSDPTLQVIALMSAPSETIYIETTADKHLSNTLKSKIRKGWELIFSFLKSTRPDLTGFVEDQSKIDFMVVEFKNEPLILDDIYQLKKYADLFDAKYSLLISTDEIPDELKRLRDVIPDLLSRSVGHNKLTIVHYDIKQHSFLDWFPEDPFPDNIM